MAETRMCDVASRFKRFIGDSRGLDVDKDDLRRYSDFVDRKVYDLLLIGQPTDGELAIRVLSCRLL